MTDERGTSQLNISEHVSNSLSSKAARAARMRRPGFLAASEALLLLLAVSLGYCDAKRTLKVVSILVSELFTLQKKITPKCSELELVSVLAGFLPSCYGAWI